MGLRALVSNNGMSGELYLTIVTSTDEKFSGVTRFLVRGFESRDVLYEHIKGNLTGNIIAFEEEYEMPIVDMEKPKWEQHYKWLRENIFLDAVDVIE